MKEISGNLFDFPCEAICITTNGTVKKDGCAVMGRGVALVAKTKWDGLDLILGNQLAVFGNHVAPLKWDGTSNKCIVNFPVKDAWFNDAKMDLIKQSCDELVSLATIQEWKVVVLPRPGCGNGNLKWEDVKPEIEKRLDDRFIVINNED